MRRRSGLTLIEVLAALAILGVGGAALAGMLGQGMYTVRGARARDAQMQDAAEQLARASVWTSADFMSRLGRFNSRGFVWSVVVITPSLYEVTISDTLGPTLLRTSFYVPDSSGLARQ